MNRFSLLAPALLAANGVLGAKWIGEVKKVDGLNYQCKCCTDNSRWPTNKDWEKLNKTVDSTLQVAVPPGAVCHKTFGNSSSVYDAAKCADTQANWGNEQWPTDHPIANLWPFGTNNTCLPTSDPSEPCTRGFYGNYVIVARTKDHIKVGVDFARERNLRLIIRNTGHDCMGRSTGFGSLIVNTHSFKDVKFIAKYGGPSDWTGMAATVGASVQGRELFRQALHRAQSNCTTEITTFADLKQTVGWAGGYIQSIGADNVLSFDTIIAKGEYVTANAKEHPDLYWALKGGGPSSFAVVTSITVKTFPEIPTASTIVNINSTHTNDTELFAKAVKIFHNLSNHYANNGMFVYFELGPGPQRLHIAPFVGPNMDEAKLNTVLKPFFDQLDAAKVPCDKHTKSFPTFFDFYFDMFEDEPLNQQSIIGGRLFTQADITANGDKSADALIMAAMPEPTQLSFNVGHIVNPGPGVPQADNAINPTWRNASSFVITNVIMSGTESWAVNKERESFNTNVIGKALRDVSPNGASYVNEGDLYEPNWQQAYWGSKYARLLQIRQKYDPDGVFYTQIAPGTEN
ncbi:FAD-binding domain-containing protein [Setomelanomma holmii]|uniref:FAD-binding domain-containing protein n=1 Tax=Setomelanomma holmii TaxID=210430 RepID=A0A9P4HBN9_9PLEO|nr:FAD-binding domain-containing protein [Setomelanomma holmii]